MKRAVFIDRDGTISEEVGYINHPSRFRLFPYAASAIKHLNENGWLAILVTNQAGVARGYFSEDMIQTVHAAMAADLESNGAKLDAIYYCAHHPSVGEPPYRFDCDCRKPKPGLISSAAQDFDIDLNNSWMVGDRYGDIELARNAGLKSGFVLSGYGRGEWEHQRTTWSQQPDLVTGNLLDAVSLIVGEKTMEPAGKSKAASALWTEPPPNVPGEIKWSHATVDPLGIPISPGAVSTKRVLGPSASDRILMQKRLISILKRFSQRRILVVGDAVADQFVYGAISRVSREAPVFILAHEHTETVPGGAANCAVNLASLGAAVSLVSVAGEDEAGRTLVDKLKAAGVDCSGLLTSKKLRTTTKVRILAGQIHSTRQQVIRIDYEGEHLNDADLRARLRESVLEQAQAADAVIISDYNYGVADAEMSTLTRDAALVRKIPVFADSRFSLLNFNGFTSATPNQDEVEQLLGRQFSEDRALELAGEELRERLHCRALLVTRGSQGMMLFEDGVAPVQFEPVGSREPVDVTGAGDTVMAAYSLAIASDSSFADAARLANYAGGLVVMKRGTASITGEELKNSVLHSELPSS